MMIRMAGLAIAASLVVPAALPAGAAQALGPYWNYLDDAPIADDDDADVVAAGYVPVEFTVTGCGSVTVVNPAENPEPITVFSVAAYDGIFPGEQRTFNLNGFADDSRETADVVVNYQGYQWAPVGSTAHIVVAYEAPILWCQSFPDVGPSHLFFDEIEWLVEDGITEGYADGLYRPGNMVNRGSMAALLYRSQRADVEGYVFDRQTFRDVPPDHLFFEHIEWLAFRGITHGYGDGTYRPGNVVNRGSMAAMMFRMYADPDYQPPAVPSFSDVPPDHPFYREIEWLVRVQVTEGYPDGTYRPGNLVNRGSMAAFLFRLERIWDFLRG